MEKRISLTGGSITSLFIFSFIAVYVKGGASNDITTTLLSVGTFLFGIFGAFVMQNRHKRLNDIGKDLREIDNLFINIYRIAKSLGGDIQKKTQKLIDGYYQSNIDHELFDFNKANKEFLVLFDYISKLAVESDNVEIDRMLDNVMLVNSSRKEVEYVVKNKMLKFEWFVLTSLLFVIIFSVFYINDGTIVSILISILLSTSGTVFLLIIRDLEELRWKEQRWIWEPLEQFFQEIDLDPYYPENILRLKRARPNKKIRKRIGYFPNPYPDHSGKKIKIEY